MKKKNTTFILLSIGIIAAILTISVTLIKTQKEIESLKTENQELRQNQNCEYHMQLIEKLEDENLNLQQQINDNKTVKEEIRSSITAFLTEYYEIIPGTDEGKKRKQIEQYVDVKTYQELYPYPISEDDEYQEGIDYSTSMTVERVYIDLDGFEAEVFVMSEYKATVFQETTLSTHIFDCTMQKQEGKWIITDIHTQNFIKLL